MPTEPEYPELWGLWVQPRGQEGHWAKHENNPLPASGVPDVFQGYPLVLVSEDDAKEKARQLKSDQQNVIVKRLKAEA